MDCVTVLAQAYGTAGSQASDAVVPIHTFLEIYYFSKYTRSGDFYFFWCSLFVLWMARLQSIGCNQLFAAGLVSWRVHNKTNCWAE